MSKLIKVLLVVFSTFAISNYASAVTISAGIAGNAMLGFGEAVETNGEKSQTADGMMDMSHAAIFAEVGTDMFALGVEYNMEDIDTPEADAIRVDMTTAQSFTAQTNTVKATIQDMVTVYVQAMVPNSGFYGKLGIVNADVATKENLGTGGSYGDESIDGTLVGVGYRAQSSGQKLDLSLGFSHNIVLSLPDEIKIETVNEKGKNPVINITSFDKQLVGMVAAKIRSYRKPEPYKGKGVKFVGEEIRRKAGKSA